MRTDCQHHEEQGFSLIDLLIAITILMVGILTFAGVLTATLVQTSSGENYLRAKVLASTTLESVMGARYVVVAGMPYSFNTIRNSNQPGGIFDVGRKMVHEKPGPDGLFGTSDDDGAVLPEFEREIVIEDVPDPLRPTPPNPITERQITITIYYKERGFERKEILKTSVANY